MEVDNYLTIKEGAKGIYKEKGSKFIAISKHVESEDEFKLFQEEIKKEEIIQPVKKFQYF